LNLLRTVTRRRSPPDEFAAEPDDRSAAAIAFDGLEVRRGERKVLDIPRLRLAERRIGLIGDNGSGKSTLLRLINGLLLPTSGQVTVRGLDTARHRKSLPAEVGFVFQNPDHQLIFPTVGEEIAFGLTERGLSPAEARSRVAGILARHRRAEWTDRAVHTLSGGQRQLVCILAVTAPEPPILLLDEPFSSLDLPTRLALSRYLAELPQQIVMASHDFDLFENFERIIWLDSGVIRADGPPDEVMPAYAAHAARGAATELEP
jgi:biotin transport system ATP-binding protein